MLPRTGDGLGQRRRLFASPVESVACFQELCARIAFNFAGVCDRTL